MWLSSPPGALSTLVTSVAVYSLTRTTLMSPGQDETSVCGYIYIYIYIYIYNIIYIYIYIYLPRHVIVKLPHLRSRDSRTRERFYVFSIVCSADKQTRNHNKECSNHHPY